MSRWRAVIKDMSKMASAIRAMNLGSDHGEASINGCLDGTLDRIVKGLRRSISAPLSRSGAVRGGLYDPNKRLARRELRREPVDHAEDESYFDLQG